MAAYRRIDYLVIAIVCFFLGLFVYFQYSAGKAYKKAIEPENSNTIALEVAKLTKSNADLRTDVKKLTTDFDEISNSSISSKVLYDKFIKDSELYDQVNSSTELTGQGVIISIKSPLTTPQIVDLVNTIKNIGSGQITINGQRIVLNTDLSKFSMQNEYELKVLGNSDLLKSAMERRGGIVDQIQTKDLKITISESNNLVLPKGQPLKFKYGKIILQ